jgi:hypothetical protein
MYNRMKLTYLGLKIRLLLTDFFRIRNVYFGSGSDPDPVESFGSFWIWFRIRNMIKVFSRNIGVNYLTFLSFPRCRTSCES